jgi:hypothetical protein
MLPMKILGVDRRQAQRRRLVVELLERVLERPARMAVQIKTKR